jgi:hypothetical protein
LKGFLIFVRERKGDSLRSFKSTGGRKSRGLPAPWIKLKLMENNDPEFRNPKFFLTRLVLGFRVRGRSGTPQLYWNVGEGEEYSA